MKIKKQQVNSRYCGLIKDVLTLERFEEEGKQFVKETRSIYYVGIPVRRSMIIRPASLSDSLRAVFGGV